MDALRRRFGRSLGEGKVPTRADVAEFAEEINRDDAYSGRLVKERDVSTVRRLFKSTTLFKPARVRPRRFQTTQFPRLGILQIDGAVMKFPESNDGAVGFVLVVCVATGVMLAKSVTGRSRSEYARVIAAAAAPSGPFPRFTTLQSDGDPALTGRTFVAKMKEEHGITLQVLGNNSAAWSCERGIR